MSSSKRMPVMSQVVMVRTQTLSAVHQVFLTALATFLFIYLFNICWNQQAHFAPPTTDVFMYFQFITVFASWDMVQLCHHDTIQRVLRTGARLFPVVWKFPLHTTALSQCCCSIRSGHTQLPLASKSGWRNLLPVPVPASSHHRDTMRPVSVA